MRWLSTLILCATAFGCGESATVLRVTVDLGPGVPAIDELNVQASSALTEEPGARTFDVAGVELPVTFTVSTADQDQDVELRIEGLAGGRLRGLGLASATAQLDVTTDVEVELITADFPISPTDAEYRLASESPAGGGAQVATTNGGETMVVFVVGPEGCPAGGCSVLGRVFDASGQPVETASGDALPFQLAAATEQPVVASSGTDVLAVFVAPEVEEGAVPPVQGMLLTPDDDWAPGLARFISDAPTEPLNPTVNHVGAGLYAVAWSDVATERQIFTNTVVGLDSGIGEPGVAGTATAVSTSGQARQPSLATVGNGFLALWRGAGLDSPNDLLKARSVALDGTPDPAGEVTIDQGAVFSAVGSLGLGDGTVVVAYPRGGQEVPLGYDITSLQGTSSGAKIELAPRAGEASRPQLVSTGERELAVVYHSCPPQGCDVYMQRYSVADDGLLSQIGETEMVPADPEHDQLDPTVSVIPNAEGSPVALFVAWTEERGADTADDAVAVEGRIVPLAE